MHNRAEERRNRILRRADWRYLLGNPTPEKSVCFNDGLLAEAVQAVSAHFIPVSQVTPGECDLAVVSNPGPTALRNAWEALRPRGSFYSEWTFPLAGGTKRIRKRLEAAGFSHVVCYWPWPIPDRSPALFWLPVDAPQVIRYFLSSRPHPKNLFSWFKSGVLKILWQAGRNTGLLAPICVTACKANTSGSNAFPTVPEDEIYGHWGDDKIGGLPRQFDYLMWTGGIRSINKVVLYMFRAGEEKPGLVAKYPRTPETIASLTHEAHNLRVLHARKGEAAKRAPMVLFLHEMNGMAVLGETTVFGERIYTVFDRGDNFGLAMKVTEWLTKLVGNEPYRPRAVWWDQIVEPVLRDFEGSYGPVLEDFILPKCLEILNRLGDLPPAYEHRDVSPWNLLITTSGELAVIDWESAEPDGLPFLDLAYFLAYLAFFVDGAMETGKFIESYRRTSDPLTSTGCLQAACQQRYCEITGLDPAVLPPLRLLTWLIHARAEIHHQWTDAGDVPQPADLRSGLFYNLVLEELAQYQTSTQVCIH